MIFWWYYHRDLVFWFCDKFERRRCSFSSHFLIQTKEGTIKRKNLFHTFNISTIRRKYYTRNDPNILHESSTKKTRRTYLRLTVCQIYSKNITNLFLLFFFFDSYNPFFILKKKKEKKLVTCYSRFYLKHKIKLIANKKRNIILFSSISNRMNISTDKWNIDVIYFLSIISYILYIPNFRLDISNRIKWFVFFTFLFRRIKYFFSHTTNRSNIFITYHNIFLSNYKFV